MNSQEVLYYKLLKDKIMGDGQIIRQNESLIFIKKEANKIFFENNQINDVFFLWLDENEVVFDKIEVENWSEEKIFERNRYINGELL
jgi:hypothetical protein